MKSVRLKSGTAGSRSPQPKRRRMKISALERYGPGHPETIKEAIRMFRGQFEPEFWEVVRAVRDMDTKGLPYGPVEPGSR